MKITRSNYKGYFKAYLDGTLTWDEIRELHAFLLLNDDLPELTEEIQETRLVAPKIVYPRKQLLRKDSLHACPDYYAIAQAENCLTSDDLDFLKYHPGQAHSNPPYAKIRLMPDANIRYPHKNKLYHPVYHRTFLLKWSSIAAALVICIGILYLLSARTTPATALWSENALYLTPPVPVSAVSLSLPISKIRINPSVSFPDKLQLYRIKTNQPPYPSIRTLAWTKLNIGPDNYALSPQKQDKTLFHYPEIFLAEDASIWKPSVSNFSTDNIFSSMVHTGKLIAEKIRQKEVTK